MTLGEAIQKFARWKNFDTKNTTTKSYNLILRQFAVFMHNCDIEDVKVDHVLNWFELLCVMEYDANTFIPRAIALRNLFDFHRRNGLNVLDPFLIPVPQKSYKMQRVATADDYNKLMQTMTNDSAQNIRNRAIVGLLWDTGARNGEICSMNVSDIDLLARRAVIQTEKNRGSRPLREIFWTPQTNIFLENWIIKREFLKKSIPTMDPTALFIGICVGNLDNNGQRLTNKAVGEMLRRSSHRAGIKVVNAHSFRHRMGHHIIQSGGTNSDVSNILGHASLASSFIYTQMRNKELQDRYNKFMGI